MPRVSVAAMRALERHAIEVVGLPGAVLMENAGAGAARLLLARAPEASREVVVVTGAGNNGGDGWVLARHVALTGRAVRVLTAVADERLRGDAAVMARAARAYGVRAAWISERARWAELLGAALEAGAVVVDAVLGTGATGAPRGEVLGPIEVLARPRPRRAQGARLDVLALDVPSGLDADDGSCPGPAVRADVTATFGLPKLGLAAAREHVGELVVVPIGIPTGPLPETA